MTSNNPTKREKEEIRGSFETPVTFEMVWKTAYAWLKRANLVHKGIKIRPKR